MARKMKDRSGQMMVELCIVLPVIIVVAVIAVNALMFFGDCAQFDRISRNAVCTFASSPDSGQDAGEVASAIQAQLESACNADNLSSSVEVFEDANGYDVFTATLEFSPTLFGLGLRCDILGIPLPKLTHSSRMTVSPYKPGMLF